MISIYRILSYIIYPILIVLIYFRRIFDKEDKIRYKEKIFPSSSSKTRDYKRKLIWFHAASVGEVQSIFPIIKNLKDTFKNYQILITTVTVSSAKLVHSQILNNDNNNLYHRYFPLDVDFLTKRFIDSWKPDVIFFVDSEIWPNLILNIKLRNIPLAILNARITSKTFKRWLIAPNTAKKIFSSFDLCLSSNSETKKYLENLGAGNIHYIGNIKFCANVSIKNINNVNSEILNKKNFWCAVSTHKEEEEFCVKTHLNLKSKVEKLLTIIVPRHIDRCSKIKKISEKYNLKTQVLNRSQKILDDKEIVIVNSYGETSNFLKYSKSVFIGKSMIKRLQHVGGQNPLIAAKLGCKIYHGPFVYNFKEVYDFLNENGLSIQLNNIDHLSNYLLKDFKNEKKEILASNQIIENFGQKILNDTISKINKFINET